MKKREPSLHIKYNDFKHVIGIVMGIEDKDQLEGIASEVFFRGKPYSVSTRSMTISNERMEKKAARIIQSSRRDADLLASLIYATRRRMKHRGITQIQPSSRDWGMVKEMAAHALDFCNEFDLDRRSGFLKYIEVGLSKMQKFGLAKYLNMYEGICLTYQAMIEIEQDPDAETTKEMYEIYSQRVIDNTGINDRLEELPDKYVWFARARAQAEQMNAAVGLYMNAQFEGLDFTKGIPHPTQLVGPKAHDRVVRYCYEHGYKLKKND